LSYSNQGNFANTPIPKGNVTTVADFTNTMPRIAGGLDSMHSAPSGYGMVVPKTGQTTVQDLSNNIGALPALSSGSPLDQALAKKSAPRSTGPSPLARANATAIARAGHSSGWRSGIGGEGIGSGWSTVAPENWGTLFEILGQQTGSNDRSMVRNAQQEY
jgi:hypothetical protein